MCSAHRLYQSKTVWWLVTCDRWVWLERDSQQKS